MPPKALSRFAERGEIGGSRHRRARWTFHSGQRRGHSGRCGVCPRHSGEARDRLWRSGSRPPISSTHGPRPLRWGDVGDMGRCGEIWGDVPLLGQLAGAAPGGAAEGSGLLPPPPPGPATRKQVSKYREHCAYPQVCVRAWCVCVRTCHYEIEAREPQDHATYERREPQDHVTYEREKRGSDTIMLVCVSMCRSGENLPPRRGRRQIERGPNRSDQDGQVPREPFGRLCQCACGSERLLVRSRRKVASRERSPVE